jgi:UDP-glucose 4-epimerase
MRVLVTGGRGKVGSHAATALRERGHSVTLTDLGGARYGPPTPGALPYIRADLTDYGVTIGTVMKARPDVVVHCAGIPDNSHDPPHVVFANNTVANYNVAEAAARSGVSRLVYLSSETAIGYVTAERPAAPDYLPVDEEHPVRPQEAYALSKVLGESICDALVRRSDVSAVSIRPSLVLGPEDYPNIVPMFQQHPTAGRVNVWSYVDVVDLAELVALAVEASTPGHELVYAAQPDNYVGRPLKELVDAAYGDDAPELRKLERDDSSGITSAKAHSLFGWQPARSWRDHESAAPPSS